MNEETIINEKSSINNNLEEPKTNNNNILNEPTIINETINNILEKTNSLEEPKINSNILNEQSKTINNLEEPKINDNILNEQSKTINKESKTINNFEKPKISNNKKSNFVKTPEFLILKKVLLNPLTTDNNSFQDSIILSLHHKRIGKNNCRPNKIRKYSDTLNWENINFPPTYEDYGQFEIDNEDVNLNILSIKGDEKEIDYTYKSQFKFDRDYEVDLLLLENKHYTCVKDLAPLLLYSPSESQSESKS